VGLRNTQNAGNILNTRGVPLEFTEVFCCSEVDIQSLSSLQRLQNVRPLLDLLYVR
jgi:hypothetical protein